MLKKQRGTLESLRIHQPAAPGPARRRELGYELCYREAGSDRSHRLLLRGRLLEAEAAQTDYAVARTLARGPFRLSEGLRIPEPLSAFKGQPQVVFYPFEGVVDFDAHLASLREPDRLAAMARVGEGLRAWHRCGLKPIRRVGLGSWLSQRRAALDAGAERLEAAQPGSARVVSQAAARLESLVAEPASTDAVPVHGHFGWDCVLHDGATLLFYEFEHACAAHPGLDLGGFLADLRARQPELGRAFCDAAEQALLGAYPPGAWARDLPHFVALAALRRVEEWLHAERARPDELARWCNLLQGVS
jgi:aminoglycoside phosphotransferase (APT) family kinase protein